MIMIEVKKMYNIRPVSDLRNKWNEVDEVLTNTGEPLKSFNCANKAQVIVLCCVLTFVGVGVQQCLYYGR